MMRLFISLLLIPAIAFGQANQPIKADASYNVLPLRINGNPPNLPAGSLLDGLPIATGSGAVWGNITGTLSNQTDLQSALDAKQNSLGFTPENVANKSTSTSLGTSDTLYPSQKAVKTYVDALVAGITVPVTSVFGRTGAVTAQSGDYSEAQISFTDITTNDATTSAHGYHQKLPGDPTLFENGEGTYVPITVANNQGSRLISGGGVAWTGSGLIFTVSAADYIINGVEYTSPQTNVTLSAADPSLDRIDSFYVDTSGTDSAITGTPASQPVAPNVDPATQLYLTFAYIPAGATTPTVTNVDIYLENTEWTTSTNSAGTINLASTNNPFAGTKDVEGTNTANGNLLTMVKPSGTLKPTDYTSLILQLRSKATWPNPKALSVFWMSGATAVGTAATIKQGAFGFDSSNTTTYQQIVIPTSTFNTGTSSVDRLRVQVTGGGSNIGWYIDNVILQAAGGGTTSGGDFSTNTTTSVANEIVLFADTTGKLGKRSTGTGLLQVTSGVLSSPTPAPLTKTDDTNVTLTLGGSPTTALVNSTSLTLGWTGTLAIARGGTGAATVSAQTVFGNNTGSTAAPAFSSAPQFLKIGNLTSNGFVKTSGGDGTLSVDTATYADSSFKTISVSGQSDVVADSAADTLTLAAGTGITITTNAGTDTVTITGSASQTHAVTFVMDGYGSVLTARTGSYIKIPYGGTLTGWTLIASPASSSITVDIIRATDTNGLPSASIVGGGGTKPAISNGVENKSTSFTGWTSTTLNAFDNLAITTSGITTATYMALTLYYQ